MLLSVASGIMEIVGTGTTAGNGTCAGLARRQASLVSATGRPHMLAPVTSETRQSRSGSTSHMDILGEGWGVTWELKDFIEAHRAVKASGVFNFEGCRIPIPTPIRYDRIRESLGPEASPKELRVLKLLEFGFPIDLSCFP